MSDPAIPEMTRRSTQIFNEIVKNYLQTGSPVGSGLIAAASEVNLSSASVRAIMAELEGSGLLFSPHTSAGRVPTGAGLRLFVDGLMEVRDSLALDEHGSIDALEHSDGLSVNQMLDKASLALSGLSKCASLVMTPTEDLNVNHIEFVPIQDNRILVILVFSNGHVENRMIAFPAGLPGHVITQASNYMNSQYKGKSVSEILKLVEQDKEVCRAELDSLTSDLIERGVAIWSDHADTQDAALIVNGQANLLEDVRAVEDLARVRVLFDKLEMRGHTSQLMDKVLHADGLQIFIGSENQLFSQTGCSMVLAPYHNSERKIIGAVGVIGPRHMNYARIIPMVDYTSKTIAKVLG
jgi:heat-inducible transcriptional repressor